MFLISFELNSLDLSYTVSLTLDYWDFTVIIRESIYISKSKSNPEVFYCNHTVEL